MKKTSGKTAVKIIAYILIVLVIVGVIGIIVKFTNGFTSDFKTFYLCVDGKDIMSSADGYVMSSADALTVNVKYTFDNPKAEKKGYSVKVVPNRVEGKDFDFILDNMAYSFQAEKDLTKGFVIETKEDSFTIKSVGNITDILRAVYPNSEVEDCADKSYTDMFSIVVTSYNRESAVVINCSVLVSVTDVTLDKEVIVF